MSDECTLEMMFEIWHDGECMEVGPDRDGLDLIEIRYRGPDHKITNRMTFTLDQATMLQKALERLIVEMGRTTQ